MPRLAVLAVVLAACVKPGPYRCAEDDDCGAGGRCLADQTCATADGGGPGIDARAASPALCTATVAPSTEDPCAAQVCERDPSCCTVSWDELCAQAAAVTCRLECAQALAAASFTFASVVELDLTQTGATASEPRWTSLQHDGWAYRLAWGDVDADQRPELAVAREVQNGWNQSGLALYRNEGRSGTSVTLTSIAVDGATVGSIDHLDWRDFDRDGDLDLLASGLSGLYLAVAEGGTFTVHRLASDELESVAWVDADGASPWLIAVGHRTPASVKIHQLTGPPYAIDAGAEIYAGSGTDLAWCDVTGNATRDLVIVNYDRAQIATGTATGFMAAAMLDVFGHRVACADLDGDRDADLLVGGGNRLVTAFRNAGGLDTANPWRSTEMVRAEYLTAGDLDGDGLLDVVLSDSFETTSPLRVLRNTSSTTGLGFTEVPAPDINGAAWTSQGLDLGPLP